MIIVILVVLHNIYDKKYTSINTLVNIIKVNQNKFEHLRSYKYTAVHFNKLKSVDLLKKPNLAY